MKQLIFQPESFHYQDHKEFGVDAAFLLHTIIFKYMTDARFSWGDEVPLKTEYLQHVVPARQLKKVLNYCEERDLICINKHYVKGSHCRRYGLGYSLLGDNIIQLDVNDWMLVSRIDKLRQFNRDRRTKNFKDVDKYIMNCVQTRVDYTDLLALTEENLIYFANCRSEWDKKERCEHEQINYMRMLLTSISNGEHNPVKDKNGRLYNSITYLQREMRPLLKLDGAPIVFQDISHTHPLLLYLLFAREYKNYNINKDNGEEEEQQQNNTTLMKYRLRLDQVRQRQTKNYKLLVENGLLYKLVAEALNLPVSDVKVQLLSFLYDHPRENCKYAKVFSELFPQIYDYILEKKGVDYKFLGNYLQGVEADIILNRVCEGLMRDYPGIPLVTVHDCIGTTPPYKQIVYDAMMKEFKYLGLSPKIKEQ